MKLAPSLRTLARGVKLVAGLIKAQVTGPNAETSTLVVEEHSGLISFGGFGENPGGLRMWAYVPPAPTGRPLVVLLHGCGQHAAAFAVDSGWSELADRLRFVLVLPEQAQSNNAGRCFQWFLQSDTARDKGEAGSIAAMTRAAISRFGSDPKRIFIVGLSAGGAMAVALLAAYPDLFSAGASVAGLPVGSASSGLQAMLRMASGGPDQKPEDWAALARAAAPAGFTGPWPRLSVWQGQADLTVAPKNGNQLATQWRALHGLAEQGLAEPVGNGVQHQIWPDKTQRLVELWTVPNLVHGYPAGTRAVTPGPFIEQAPVDATAGIARFFGLD